jgi:hypothetical protein
LRARVVALAASAAALLHGGPAKAGDNENAASGSTLSYTLHGFVLADYAVRAGGKPPPGGGAFLFGAESGRLELALDAASIDAAARLTLDAAHDALAPGTAGAGTLDVRGAYVDYRAGPLDVRLGRQIVSWGVATSSLSTMCSPRITARSSWGGPSST